MNNNLFNSEIIKKHSHIEARVTKICTPHGEILTPSFMPVATRAFVNNVTTPELINAGTQIVLGGNTYHMLCTPGMDVIQAIGGMHKFMNWSGPMLTDSGGFQIFSLSKNSKICKINEDGAHFRHPITGQIVHLTPDSSIQTQKIIGADIIMAFDQCTPNTDDKLQVIAAMQRTHRWLIQSREFHEKNPYSEYGFKQALFGIIQGASFRDLREESTQFIVSMNLDGIAIGGETIGYDMQKTAEILDWVRPLLPPEKTRYTMGVGLTPQDLIDVVEKGIDIFDCVAPTRNARHGSLFYGQVIEHNGWLKFVSDQPRNLIHIKKSIFAKDEKPIIENCNCFTCKHYTRAYLHYLFKEKLAAYSTLACIHNIHVMHDVCSKMRKVILSSM